MLFPNSHNRFHSKCRVFASVESRSLKLFVPDKQCKKDKYSMHNNNSFKTQVITETRIIKFVVFFDKENV